MQLAEGRTFESHLLADWYLRDAGNDGSAGQFCGIPACSAYNDVLLGMGLDSQSCNPRAPIGAIVGGAIGGVLLLGVGISVWKAQMNKPAARAPQLPVATATATPMATATATPMATATAIPMATATATPMV